MSIATEVGLIAGRELRRNLRSIKGIILAVLALLGTGATTIVVDWIQKKIRQEMQAEHGLTADQLNEARKQILVKALGEDQGNYFASLPELLMAIFQVTVWLGPLLIALLCFDGLPSDVQHRGVRFWTLRAHRGSFYAGKAFGSWLTVSIVTLAMNVLVWVVAGARGSAPFGTCLSWGFRLWLYSLPISAAWCGLATLVSSLTRSPIVSLLITFASFFLLWFVGFAIAGVTDNEVLGYLYPNSYDRLLMSVKAGKMMTGLGLCAVYAVGTTLVGTWLFARRDV